MKPSRCVVGRSLSLKFKRYVQLVLAVALSSVIQSPTRSATLDQLFNGGSLVSGNAIFSDWQLISADATAGTTSNLLLLNVTPLVNDPTNPGLQFSASGQLSIVGLNAIDLTFKYRVQAIGGAGSFTANTLSLSGIVFGNNSGVAYISGENKNFIGNELASTVVIDDKESGVGQLVSTGSFTGPAKPFWPCFVSPGNGKLWSFM